MSLSMENLVQKWSMLPDNEQHMLTTLLSSAQYTLSMVDVNVHLVFILEGYK